MPTHFKSVEKMVFHWCAIPTGFYWVDSDVQ